MKKTLALVALASCVSAPAGAASPPPVPENLQACSKLSDAGERVRCYDAQIAAMNAAAAGTAANSTPTSPAGASQVNSASPTSSARSGATNSPRAQASSAATAARAPAAAPTPAPGSTPAAPTTSAPAVARAGSAASQSAPSGNQPAPAVKFGEEFLPQTVRPPKSAAELALSSNIIGLHQIGPDVYNISLANGQVWRQEGAQVTAFFRVGDDVRIKKGMLGSYQMSTGTTGSKNWVRVTRLQ